MRQRLKELRNKIHTLWGRALGNYTSMYTLWGKTLRNYIQMQSLRELCKNATLIKQSLRELCKDVCVYIYIYMVSFENLLTTLLWEIRPFGQASDRASDTFGHCSVFSFSWKSPKMEPKKWPKDTQTIMNIFSYYLVLTRRSNSNFDMSSKCLPKLTWASRKPFPSDKLRTTFGHFLPCSKRYLATGRAGVPAEAWVSTWVSVSGSGFGVWLLGFRVSNCFGNYPLLSLARNTAESEAVGSSDGSLTEAKIISRHLS